MVLRIAARELLWDFIEMCDVSGRIPVFYQIDEDRAAMYVETGLRLLKVGEEARVSLQNFNLEGSARSDFRRANRKVERSGMHI